MLGIRAIKPRTKVAIEPNCSSKVPSLCKKMKMLKRASINIGMNMVEKELFGIL